MQVARLALRTAGDASPRPSQPPLICIVLLGAACLFSYRADRAAFFQCCTWQPVRVACWRPHFFPKDKPSSVAQAAHCVRIILYVVKSLGAALRCHLSLESVSVLLPLALSTSKTRQRLARLQASIVPLSDVGFVLRALNPSLRLVTAGVQPQAG